MIPDLACSCPAAASMTTAGSGAVGYYLDVPVAIDAEQDAHAHLVSFGAPGCEGRLSTD